MVVVFVFAIGIYDGETTAFEKMPGFLRLFVHGAYHLNST
jgi:hypothetical protein